MYNVAPFPLAFSEIYMLIFPDFHSEGWGLSTELLRKKHKKSRPFCKWDQVLSLPNWKAFHVFSALLCFIFTQLHAPTPEARPQPVQAQTSIIGLWADPGLMSCLKLYLVLADIGADLCFCWWAPKKGSSQLTAVAYTSFCLNKKSVWKHPMLDQMHAFQHHRKWTAPNQK